MMLFVPVLLPLSTIVLLLFGYRSLRWQQTITIISLSVLLIHAANILFQVAMFGPIAMQAGGWQAPYGITFVADLMAAIMLFTTSLLALIVTIYSIGFVDELRKRGGFYVLLQGLITGVNGSFLTGDIFNLYVWFEVMLISSFILMTLGGTKQQLRGALKYVVINLIGSMLFVSAIGLLYGQVGSLNMADIAMKIREVENIGHFNSALMLFFVAFGIKAALFPFFFWLPASYPMPPVAITALFAGTLTKVGIYVLIRFNSLFVVADMEFFQTTLLIIGGITMVTGVIMAASSYDIRKILSFHIISQIGYMVMGLGLATVMGIGAAIYFTVHNMLSKTGTFLAGGLIYKFGGTYDLKYLGGIYKARPLIAILFLLPALSLAGIPPTPGFFGKLFLIYGGFSIGAWAITATAIMVSILTMFSMIKIWNEAIWKKAPDDALLPEPGKVPKASLWASIVLVAVLMAMGLSTGFLADYFFEAGRQVLDTDLYIQTVLKNFVP